MKLFFKVFFFNLLCSSLLIDNSAYAQVNLPATGVGNCKWGCKRPSSSISKTPDNILCNRVSEGKSDYLLEAKRRGLACADEYEKKAVNVQNNSPSSFSSKSYSSNLNKLPNNCRNYTYPTFGYPKKSQVQNDKDDKICRFALNPMQNGWDNVRRACPFVIEAINRTFTVGKCQNLLGVKDDKSSSGLYKFSDDWRVCDEVKMGKQEWINEASRRGLNCGVNAAEAEKKKQAILKKIAAEAQEEEKARQKRIKAEQEKIKKKAAEKALKKKIADEKARKIAEKKAKKEAEIKAKKLAQEKLKIKNAKEESVGFYKDIISYVKTANDIDVVQLSEFFEKKPEPEKKWNVKDLQAYQKLKKFINKSVTFREFHTNEKDKRAKAKLNLKLATIGKLEENLKNFEIIMKENFGNSKKTKLIREYINKTKKIVSDDKYQQNLADEILLENETYLITYKMNKNKLFEINAYLNASKNELSQILKDNFGTKKGNKASKYLKNIESAKSLSEKTELKSVIERFITPPQQIVSGQKQERNKITSNLNSSEFSNIADNIICNRANEGNADYLLEAKRRVLSCGASSANSQNAQLNSKNLYKNQNIIKPQKKISEEERKKAEFESSLAINQQNIEIVDFKALAEKHVKETELQNDKTEKELKDKFISITGLVTEVDRKKGTKYGYTKYLIQLYQSATLIDGLHATCGSFYAYGQENEIIENLKMGDTFSMSGEVYSYGDWLGLQLQNCSISR